MLELNSNIFQPIKLMPANSAGGSFQDGQNNKYTTKIYAPSNSPLVMVWDWLPSKASDPSLPSYLTLS